jgi:large subunit ribosomal protein L21
MKYAVIKTGGKQYKVQEGDTLLVERLSVAENKPVEFDEVLLVVDEGKIKLGQPTLKAKVTGKLVNQLKDKKISVSKYKAKSGYHRSLGFRRSLSKVVIEKIEG